MTTLTGAWPVVRLILRRDRLRLSLWLVSIPALVAVQAIAVLRLYPDQQSIDGYVGLFGGNPALVAFAGPGYGFDDPNTGVVLVNEIQLFGCIAMALMSMFLVVRHTRGEEESERLDLIRSTIVGRHAPTAAAVAVVGALNLVVGVACAVAVVALGFPTAGSLALAGSLTAVGLVFAGVAAVAAQVAAGSRGALGLTGVLLAAAFVVRAAGDIAGNGLSWLSPLGWGQAVRAYADERWWTLALCAAVAGLLVVAAFRLSSRRDLGSGLRPLPAGPPRAARWLTSPLGLAFRLQRGTLAGWIVGVFLTGAVFGSLGEDVDALVRENPAIADFLAQQQGVTITDSYLATSLMLMALAAGGYAISAALQLRGEENGGHAEMILAGAVGRARWAGAHLLVAAAGTLLVVAAGGLGVGVAYAAVSGDAAQAWRLLSAALVTVPAVLVLIGLAALVFGALPRVAPAMWAALTVMVLIGYFGDLLQLPGWLRGVSPLEHLPRAPAEAVAAAPVLAVTALAGALAAAGLAALRRRDMRLR